jgi:drug/metabolite transporter (DMT)-like permease
MKITGIFYLLLMIAGTTSGQIFMKMAGKKLDAFKLKELILNYYIYLAFLCIASVPFTVNLALDFYPLSTVYSITGVYYLLVPLAGKVIFKEKITRLKFIGILLIFAGVFVYNV